MNKFEELRELVDNNFDSDGSLFSLQDYLRTLSRSRAFSEMAKSMSDHLNCDLAQSRQILLREATVYALQSDSQLIDGVLTAKFC